MEFSCILQVTFDEIEVVLTFSPSQPIDLLRFFLGQPREARLWHGITHCLAVEIVRLEIDDVVYWFAGVGE